MDEYLTNRQNLHIVTSNGEPVTMVDYNLTIIESPPAETMSNEARAMFFNAVKNLFNNISRALEKNGLKCVFVEKG